MKNRINSEFSFEVWINNDFDSSADELIGSFDDNWIISAGDLFGQMDFPIGMPHHDEPLGYYEEAA